MSEYEDLQYFFFAGDRVQSNINLGFVLFSEHDFPINQRIRPYFCQLNDIERLKALPTDRRQYSLRFTKSGVYVDASKFGNLSRFASHSCNPNMVVERWTSCWKLILVMMWRSFK